MSTDSPSARVRGVINKLLIELCNKLQPCDKSTKEDQYSKKIKKLKHKQINDGWACEAAEGIPVDYFTTYVEELQERFSLPDKAKKSLLDILISKEKQGSPNEFTLSGNKITMFSMEYIGVTQNQKINLAFAMYDLHFEVDTGNEIGVCSISDSMKNAFCKLYQIRLYEYVKGKCLEKPAKNVSDCQI